MKARPKEPCGYSRTGWAYTITEGAHAGGCSCRPCRKPANEERALREWRESVDRRIAGLGPVEAA